MPTYSPSQSPTVTITTGLIPTSINLTGSTGPSEETVVTYAGNLLDTTQSPTYGGIAGASCTLTFTASGQTTQTFAIVTGAGGAWSKDVTFPNPGTWTGTISYAGSTVYAACSATLTITVVALVVATVTTLTAPSPPIYTNTAYTFTVTLKTTGGAAIQGATVAAQIINTGTGSTTNATGVTDVNGQKAFSVTFAAAGTYTVQGIFGGYSTPT
jgi:hypothetical protein